MRSHHTDETTRVMTNVPTSADITVQQSAALSGESPAAFCDGHSSDACCTHPSPDAFADEKPIFLGHSVDAGDLQDPRTDSHTVLTGAHPNSQDASHVTDRSSSPVTATDSPCVAETSSSTFTFAATPIQTQPPPNPSDTVPPDLPSPSILRAAQPGGARRRAPSIDDLQALRSNSAQRLQLWESIRLASTSAAFRRYGVELPPSPPALTGDAPNDVFELNKPLQAAMSEFIRRARPTLHEFVELIRGQTGGDYRPNKAILPSALKNFCRGYPKLDIFVRIASEGVRVELIHPLPKQARFPSNHPSAVERINILRKNVRKEQDRWRCLVVDADIIEIWPQIFVSPFGFVDKGDGDPRLTGRVIHDLSFPESWSVNHLTDHTDVAKPTLEHCSSIAREIIRCKRTDPGTEVKVTTGDVAAAYRNACIHSEFVHVCAGHIPVDNAIVIDMSAAFGWIGSAGTYSVLGGAVAFIHGSSTDAAYPFGFYNYHWVDDYVNVAADVGSRCADIDRSLRFAMTSVMGHAAVNEDKFTPWSTRQKALGLTFDTVAATVAMSAANISKAQSLVASAIRSVTLTRRELRSLLGSLCHVATCVRPAKAFLQRLRDGERSLHRHTQILVSAAMPDDLLWWRHILRDPKLNGVPLDYFDALPEPDVTVVTDASDVGICALVPALRITLTYRFLPHERDLIEEFKEGKRNEFDINYRELLSCAFAVQAWRQPWQEVHPATRPIHVHFRIDNTSAVSWQWKMASRNTRAQIRIRLLSSWEQSFGLRLSASHIPGSENTAADAGSRRWESDSYAQLFDNLTRGWQHEPAPSSIGDLERAWRNFSESTLLPIHPTRRTPEYSSSGSGGHGCEAFSGNSSSL